MRGGRCAWIMRVVDDGSPAFLFCLMYIAFETNCCYNPHTTTTY